MSSFPSFEAELGYAVARGKITPAMADMSVLARYRDLDEARRQAAALRLSVASWTHINEQLRLRIRDQVRTLTRARAPKNVILATAHELNRGQSLGEQEVTEIVLDGVWAALPPAPRPTRHGR